MTDARNWWLALVTYERRGEAHTEFLPDNCQGACGWIACNAASGDEVRDLVEASLKADGLRLVEISNQSEAVTFDNVGALDTHLAANLAALEAGKVVVWGTVHTYRADGQA